MLGAYLGICLGVILAVLYPVLRGYITRAFPPTAAPGIPEPVKKYALLGVFSLVVGIIVLAVWSQANPNTTPTFLASVLLGFGWEATFEKLVTTPSP
jgi:MFS family permease